MTESTWLTHSDAASSPSNSPIVFLRRSSSAASSSSCCVLPPSISVSPSTVPLASESEDAAQVARNLSTNPVPAAIDSGDRFDEMVASVATHLRQHRPISTGWRTHASQ